MPNCRIDHITIVSPSLSAGSDLVEEHLGVRPQPGGEHPRMGTHNLLLRLGEATFLEVISVNPLAPKPSRPRWFELDQMAIDAAPRLGCWVARTDDIRASLSQATEHLGSPEPMSRGSLDWHISISEDGSLPLGGTAPALIQWKASAHPAASMQDKGCSLIKLELLHPEPARLNALLGSLHFSEPKALLRVTEAPVPGLVAYINTPHGLRAIGAPNPSIERTSPGKPAAASHVKRSVGN
ncbi:MAG: VOC family protein [Cyanobacteria bacterium]|nr:VOC family protein [Cyanobacteriota bacterium]